MLVAALVIAGLLTLIVTATVWRRSDKRMPVASEALDYQQLPNVSGRYTLHLSGEQFDGRQHVIRCLRVGTPLQLRREADNPHDSCAVAVTTEQGDMIGYIPRKNSEWVSRLLDRGEPLRVSTAHLFDDDDDGLIDVQVHIDDVPPRRSIPLKSDFAPIESLWRRLRDVDDAIRTAELRVTPKAQLRWYRRAGLIAETAYKQFGPQLEQSDDTRRCLETLLEAVRTAANRIHEIESVAQREKTGLTPEHSPP